MGLGNVSGSFISKIKVPEYFEITTTDKTNPLKFYVAPCPPPRTPCELRDRPYVPCSSDPKLPEFVPSASERFPLILQTPEELRLTDVEKTGDLELKNKKI